MNDGEFHILNLNPCYDHWVILESEPKIPSVVRGDKVLKVVDGKGLNIGRVFETLGETEYNTVNIVGGNVGDLIRKETAAAGINATFLEIESNNRINTAVVHEYRKEMEMINEPGPEISAEERLSIVDELKTYLEEKDGTLVIAGSAPRGLGPESLVEIVEYAGLEGFRVEMDISKKWLKALVDTEPDVLKINHDEYELAFGKSPDKYDAVREFKRNKGIDTLILTNGKEGSYAINDGKLIRARPKEIRSDFSVGSGDSFFAGLLYAQNRGKELSEQLRTASACGIANTLSYGPGYFSREEYQRELDNVDISEAAL